MADLSLTFDWEPGATDLTITVVAGHLRCEVYVPNTAVPVPITPEDKAVMLTIRSALMRMGARNSGVLRGQFGAYFLWALARHVQATMAAEGPTATLGDLTISTKTLPPADPQLPRLQNIVIG